MADYNLTQTGAEVQRILDSVAQFDSTPTEGSSNPIPSGVIEADNRVLTEAIAWLAARVAALESDIDQLGDATAQNLTIVNMPKLLDKEWISFGSGAPTSPPTCKGQFYVDTTNRAVYIATAVTLSTSNWMKI